MPPGDPDFFEYTHAIGKSQGETTEFLNQTSKAEFPEREQKKAQAQKEEIIMSEKQRMLLLSVVLVSGLISGLGNVRAQKGKLTGRDIMVKADERPDGEDHVGWFVFI